VVRDAAAYRPGMASRHRGFILHHTRLRPVPGVDTIRLHLADEVLPLWHALQVETGDPETPLPYWAFAWAGGLALARYVGERPDVVAGRRVFELGTGSGLVSIAALRAGAAAATATDIDPFSIEAAALNARANGVRLDASVRDVLDDPPPADTDVILAGDTWYEASLADRVLPWLGRAADAGLDVLIGDPGRRYLPLDRLEEIAAYDVRTTTELEDLALKRGHVFRLRR
jgi:predicted nicotinamide N-methyase